MRLLIAFLLLCSVAMAQHEPAVRLRADLYCQTNQCRMQPIAYGNAVIVGRSDYRLLIATVAHNLKDAQSVSIMVQSQWRAATVLNIDREADFALLSVAGHYQVPAAEVLQGDPPAGAVVQFDTYWPGAWERRVIRAARRENRYIGYLAYNATVIPGVSGAGVVYDGKLAGLVHGVTVAGPSTTLVVPSSTIYRLMTQWGYVKQSTTPLPVESQTASPIPGGGSLTNCDCQRQISHLSASLNQLIVRVNQIANDGNQSGRDAAPQIADLQRQVVLIQSELDALQPLLRREVILVSDGEVTSRRTLNPSDPIVLGSEIVIRKTNAGK